MDRGATPAFLTELAKDKTEPCYLIAMYFDSGTVGITNAYRDVNWSGIVFAAQGHYLGMSGFKETFNMEIPQVSITVSGVDRIWISVMLAEPYLDRRMVCWKAFIDHAAGVIADPVAVFDGRMNGFDCEDDPAGSCTVQIKASNQWTDFEFRPGRHTNAAEQEFYFPGDKFFEFTSELNREITWGRK